VSNRYTSDRDMRFSNGLDEESEDEMRKKRQEEREVDCTVLSGRCIERCPECGRNGRLKVLLNGDRKYSHKGVIELDTLRITDYCHIKRA